MRIYEFERQYSDILELLNDGATVRTWHCKPIGSKGNDAFVISRIGNEYRAYCHHCGESLVYSKAKTLNPYSTASTNPGKTREVVLPKDSNGNLQDWPGKGKDWITKYLTDDEIKKYGICYSPGMDRIVIPIYHGTNLVGYQARSVSGASPKWLTRKGNVDALYFEPSTSFSDTVIIVEDILSSIVVGRNYNTIAILGTNVKDSVLYKIVSSYDTYVVWLDDDNPQVKMKQRQLRDRLALYGPTKLITGVGCDPKELSQLNIRGVLCLGR